MTATESTLSVRTARAGLLILTLINLFNYLDRWIVAALAESMKHSELHLSDTELGSLMTGFLIVYMLTAPLFGRLGDTRSRNRLLAVGVAIWSIATALAGLARSYVGLFAARAAVGSGAPARWFHTPPLRSPLPRGRRTNRRSSWPVPRARWRCSKWRRPRRATGCVTVCRRVGRTAAP